MPFAANVEANGGHFPADVDQKVDQVARQGATPLVVVEVLVCWALLR